MVKIFTDKRCLEHQAPWGFPEQPERLRGILEAIRGSDFDLVEQASHGGVDEAVLALHHPLYIKRFRRAVERGDELLDSADNPLSEGTWQAARGALEVCLTAADHIAESGDRAAFAAVRPPGHHAEASFAMGFCYFANLALSAEYLIRRHGVERVAIFDFDVHHGNGTQHLFEQRSDVFFSSIHQYPFYPGTGSAGEKGKGEGQGATQNLPVGAGTGDEVWLGAVREQVLPAIEAFRPQVLLVSAGFDAWKGDPVGGLRISREAFFECGRWLADLASRITEGRLMLA